jgi:hypothetical protein
MPSAHLLAGCSMESTPYVQYLIDGEIVAHELNGLNPIQWPTASAMPVAGRRTNPTIEPRKGE